MAGAKGPRGRNRELRRKITGSGSARPSTVSAKATPSGFGMGEGAELHAGTITPVSSSAVPVQKHCTKEVTE